MNKIHSRPLPQPRQAPKVLPSDSPAVANLKRKLQEQYNQYFQGRQAMDRNPGDQSYKDRYLRVADQIVETRKQMSQTLARERLQREQEQETKDNQVSSFALRAAMTPVALNTYLILHDVGRISRLIGEELGHIEYKPSPDFVQMTYLISVRNHAEIGVLRKLTGELQTMFGLRLRSSGVDVKSGEPRLEIRLTMISEA